MDADTFIRKYTAQQIKAILGEQGFNKESPVVFALSELTKEKSEGSGLLNKRFLPVITTKGEGYDKYTDSQIILAFNLLGQTSQLYPEDELFLLSRSYCSSEKERLRCGEFYLLEKVGEMDLSIENGISPRYLRVYLGLVGVPEILRNQKMGNYRIAGIFDFAEMLEDKRRFYKKLFDNSPGEFSIRLDTENNLVRAGLKMNLSDLAKHGIEADLFRITKESAEKYKSDKNVEGFIKLGRELLGKMPSEKAL